MKKHYYVFWDSIAVFIIWIGIVVSSIHGVLADGWSYLYLVFSLISSIYFIPKSLQCVFFLLDIANRIKTRETVFLGVLNEELLDVFFRVGYTNVNFDDLELSGNYAVFFDVAHEEVK